MMRTTNVRDLLNGLGVLDMVLCDSTEGIETMTITLVGNSGHAVFRNIDGGGLDARYTHHPSGFCEGNGICEHCGRTMF